MCRCREHSGGSQLMTLPSTSSLGGRNYRVGLNMRQIRYTRYQERIKGRSVELLCSLVPAFPAKRSLYAGEFCACGQLCAWKAWSETSREVDVG